MSNAHIRHLELAELVAGVPEIAKSPTDNGVLRAIVVRPRANQRLELTSCRISAAGGLEGDNWASGCWKTTASGTPHPDVQICIMNARAIDLIAAGVRTNWAPAGDSFFVDLDLSVQNLRAGQQLAIGTAIIEITAEPHNGCTKFTKRYGRNATIFVNHKDHRHMRLRGVYARVVTDGMVTAGDAIVKTRGQG